MLDLFLRVIRHALTPLVVLLVSKGWLPEEVQGDLVEFLLVTIVAGLTLLWSYLKDVKIRGRTVADLLDGPDS
nr:MAG TPA: hypothetical protein [Caudoviricetes sp.]